jgi:hypothetical protein
MWPARLEWAGRVGLKDGAEMPIGGAMRVFWAILGVLWLAVVIAGFAVLGRWDNEPGAAARASAQWPAGSHIARDTTRPTLVMLAHPRCSCTRASIEELAEVMARAAHRPKAFVVFIKPGGVGAEWEKTDLWQSAAAIPDVTVLRDEHGLEAQRFGGETSGQTFLYDADGSLLFTGGTTASRGHAGDNAGRASLVALLNQHAASASGTPVFGCPLFGQHDREPATTTRYDVGTY